MLFPLKLNRRRTGILLASEQYTLASYTLDQRYVTKQEYQGEPFRESKILPGGSVLALDPSSSKVVPNYTTYGYGAVGVLNVDADCGNGNWTRDVEVDVIFRGDVFEDQCWDNGTFGSILAATRSALSKRVQFVKEKNF